MPPATATPLVALADATFCGAITRPIDCDASSNYDCSGTAAADLAAVP